MGITRQQALDCFASDDLIGIGMEADAVRRRLHPEGVVSYAMDRVVEVGGTVETLEQSVGAAVAEGATGVHLVGGAGLEAVEAVLRGVRQRYPRVWLHGLSAGAVLAMAAGASVALRDTLERLQAAGLDSLAGDDSGILDDAVALRGGRICSSAEWVGVHKTAHKLGMGSIAAVEFGGGETMEQRVDHLQTLRALQEETGGFGAFVPVAFQPENVMEEPTAVEFLQTLAICRLYLDNIAHVQSPAHAQGLKVLQMGLRFGSNDAGSAMLPNGAAQEEELRRIVREAGFKPVQRDTFFRTMFLN